MEKSAAHFVTLFPFDLYKRLNQRQASRFASVSSVWQGGSSDTENAQHFEFTFLLCGKRHLFNMQDFSKDRA